MIGLQVLHVEVLDHEDGDGSESADTQEKESRQELGDGQVWSLSSF